MPRKLYRHTRRPAASVIRTESYARRFQQQTKARLLLVMFLVFGCFASLSLRLIEVSLIGGGELPFRRLVSEPHLLLQMQERGERATAISAQFPRRTIVDRNGMLLAANVPTADLAVNPQIIADPQAVAKQLAGVLTGVNEATLAQKLSGKHTFAYIKRQLTPAEQKAVHALGIPGLFFENGMRRVYPAGDVAAHAVGFVNLDNKGMAGVEASFDSRLRFTHADNMPLQLSIDLRVQSLLMQELAKVVEEFGAIGAAGMVMDVRSGEMLGMASLPTFDPHYPAKASDDARFNRISLGVYELGSTMKTFTLALALDKGVVTPEDGFDTSFPIIEGGIKVSDYKPVYRWMSVPEIFAYSSNIGTVRMLQAAGYKEQVEFFERLGFMQKVQIDLPEKGDAIIPTPWRAGNHLTASFGHGISITPLHMGRAISAMVNGGTLPELSMLKRDADEVVKGTRVISEKTSAEVREMMRLVVDYGTARQGKVEGYQVGGKTGTAEKVINGQYHKDKKITSFVSAFPMEDPRYLIFVMVDEPKGIKRTHGYATGGWVAAPVTARITERIGPMLGVVPKFTPPKAHEVEFWEVSRNRNTQARGVIHRAPRGGVHATSF